MPTCPTGCLASDSGVASFFLQRGRPCSVSQSGPAETVWSSTCFTAFLRLAFVILGEDALRIVVEEVAAAGTADVVGFTLVADGDRANAARDDAFGFARSLGERGADARIADLGQPGVAIVSA